MLSKDHLSAALTNECDICNHLFTKLDRRAYDYRPSPTQRSATELLRYLSIIGIAGVRILDSGDWSQFQGFVEESNKMRPEEFPVAMARQKQEMEQWFASVDEKTLASKPATMPTRVVLPLAAAIIHGPVKWLSAYKLQLFLYAKATGAGDIGTFNAWAGMDAPK